MAYYLAGAIVLLALSGLMAVLAYFCFFFFDNFKMFQNAKGQKVPLVNNRRDLLLLIAAIGATISIDSSYNLLPGSRFFTRTDSVPVVWQTPLGISIAAVFLVWAMAVWFALDNIAYYFAAMVFVAGAGFCWIMGVQSGDPSNEKRTHVMWFGLSAGLILFALAILISTKRRNVDHWSVCWGAVLYNLICMFVVSVAWIGGPSFTGAFSEAAYFWMLLAAQIALFIVQPVAMFLMQGESGSILNTWTKGKLENFLQGESTPHSSQLYPDT
jgi:hypothetical protein